MGRTGPNGAERRLQIGNRLGDYTPIKPELAVENRREFVQDLYTDRAASQDELTGDLTLGTRSLSIDQYVRVEKRGHLTLASFRSKV